jgi:hypothetical protein
MANPSPLEFRESELKRMNALIDASPESPDAIEARFYRANLLMELGRIEQARTAYMELLTLDPAHFGALNNFGNLLYTTGYQSAARKAYLQAIETHPGNPMGYVNLANLQTLANETDSAIDNFEHALRLDPNNAGANRGLAAIYSWKDEALAAEYGKKGFENQPVLDLPYVGRGEPVRLLMLVASAGVVPLRHHLDANIFHVSALFVEYADLTKPLPPHDKVINAIGNADSRGAALDAALKVLEKTTAPVINHPSRIMNTGRARIAERLSGIPGVATPATLSLPRETLEEKGVDGLGFNFPLLLRSPGFHTGRYFVRVDTERDFAASLASLPGSEIFVIQFMDTSDCEGKYRKYRVMTIGGELYPLHAAVSRDWKVHYFTADMIENPEHRAEDAAFLDNMPSVMGRRAMDALHRINETLGLDYGGIDFGTNADGDVVLFEANATMVVYPPDKDERWDYRRPAVQRALDAVRRLLTAS